MTRVPAINITADDFEEYRQIRDLVERTSTEDPAPKDIAELRRLLKDRPRMWRWAGDMARLATENVLVSYHGQSAFVVESVMRGLVEMRAEMGYETSPPLERILIERVLTCWLHVNTLEVILAQKTLESHTSEGGLYWDRRVTGAQRRLTRATLALARVRKLASLTRQKEPLESQGVRPIRALTA